MKQELRIKKQENNNVQRRIKNIRAIIAGGGTGGHIFPGLAIAGALRRSEPGIEILFVGAEGKMEMQKVPEAGYNIKGIGIAGFNRSSIFKNLSLPFKLIRSWFQVRKIIKEFKPDVVVGVGGYSSFPVLRVAQGKGIPTYIHESNSLPGKANMWLGKKAVKVFVASEGMEKYFPASKISVSGNPVREELREKIDREEALKYFGLSHDRKTVLVIGGSLGARSINEAVMQHIELFGKNHLQVIWQTGKNFSLDATKIEEQKGNVRASDFINRMEMAYSAGDVVVARAGAMTIAELITQKKTSILIPYPFASEDHQTVNAKYLVDRKAALMIPDASVKDQLFPSILNLVNNDNKRKEIETNIGALPHGDASGFIANEILSHIKK